MISLTARKTLNKLVYLVHIKQDGELRVKLYMRPVQPAPFMFYMVGDVPTINGAEIKNYAESPLQFGASVTDKGGLYRRAAGTRILLETIENAMRRGETVELSFLW